MPVHKPYCVFICGVRELRLDLQFEALTNTLGEGRVHLDRTTVSFLSRNLISGVLESFRGHFGTFPLRDGRSLPGRCLLPWTTAAEPLGQAMSTWQPVSPLAPRLPSWFRLLGSLIKILSTSSCLCTKEVAMSGPSPTT